VQPAPQRVSCDPTLASPRSTRDLLRLVAPCAKGLAVVTDQTGCLMNQSGCGRSAADTGKPIFNLASAFCRQRDSAPSEQCHCTRLILCSSLASLALSCSFDQQALSCTTGASDIGQRLDVFFVSLGYRSTTSSLPSTWTAACVSLAVTFPSRQFVVLRATSSPVSLAILLQPVTGASTL